MAKGKKKIAALPEGLKGKAEKKAPVKNPLFEARPKSFRIGNDIQHKRDLTRFVRWPKYVRLQRQRAVLQKRLKIPPSVNQFRTSLDKQTASQAFKLLSKYKPESKEAKVARLRARAEARTQGKKEDITKRPPVVHFGINNVVKLVEQRKAQLVLIAHDVDPIEIVLYLPALCRKFKIPYAIIKGKAALGSICRRKTTSAAALVKVNPEDKNALGKLIENCNQSFVNKFEEFRKQWGGGVMSQRSQHKAEKLEKMRLRDLGQKI